MKKKIAVIGTVFMDIKGFSHSKYDPYGTNIGSIQFVHGGVGRNAAENLANIGMSVIFLSTIDTGASGDEIIGKLQNRGIDINNILRTEKNGMGMWLAVLNEHGELVGSISQQPDLNLFCVHIEKTITAVLDECSAVVLEIDTTKEIAACVFEAAQRVDLPVYAIVGNMSVILENTHFLSQTECFICNNIEAGKLINTDLGNVSNNKLMSIIKLIAEKYNIKKMIITNGEKGSVYYDTYTDICGEQGAIKTDVVDTTGAGDAFFSGAVASLIEGNDMKSACEMGTMLASRVIASESSTIDQDVFVF